MTGLTRQGLYEIVEGGRYGSPRGHVFDAVIGAAVLIAVSAVILSTEKYFADFTPVFERIELVCFVIPHFPDGRSNS